MSNKLGSLNIYIVLGKRLGFLLLICLPIAILISSTWQYALIWTILLIVIVSFLSGFFRPFSVPHCVKDVIEGQTELTGVVNKHSHHAVQSSYGGAVSTSRYYNVQIGEVSFEISRQIYHWLSEGDEVCVTYWPRTKVVRSVAMVKEAPEITKAIRSKKLSGEAVASMKSKYKQDAEESKKKGR